VASIHAQKNRAGNAYRVLWRQDGRQRSLTFENVPAAERFKTLLEDHGPDEALRIIELDEVGRHVPTATANAIRFITDRARRFVSLCGLSVRGPRRATSPAPRPVEAIVCVTRSIRS
jgi:hypothetical protein